MNRSGSGLLKDSFLGHKNHLRHWSGSMSAFRIWIQTTIPDPAKSLHYWNITSKVAHALREKDHVGKYRTFKQER